jgi:hypothetical protein
MPSFITIYKDPPSSSAVALYTKLFKSPDGKYHLETNSPHIEGGVSEITKFGSSLKVQGCTLKLPDGVAEDLMRNASSHINFT